MRAARFLAIASLLILLGASPNTGTSGSGSGDPNGLNETAAIFSIDANTDITAVTATAVIANGQLVEEYNPSGSWAATVGKQELCYTGAPTAVVPYVIVRVKPATTPTTDVITVSLAAGTPPLDATDIWGHMGVDDSTTVDNTGLFFTLSGDYLMPVLASGDCIAIMLSSTVNRDWRSTDIQWSVEAGPHVSRASANDVVQAGFPGGVIHASASDGKLFSSGIYASGNQGLWFRGPGMNQFDYALAGGGGWFDRFLFGRPNSQGNSASNGYKISTVDIVSKTNQVALALWPNDPTAGNPTPVFGIYAYADLYGGNMSGVPALIRGVSEDLKGRLEAIGYGTTAYGPVAGIAGDQNAGANLGHVYAVSSPGAGGGLVIGNQLDAYADFAALLADAGCVAFNSTRTDAAHANGKLFDDGDCDGTKDTGESDVGNGSGNANWGVMYWGVSNGTTFNIGNEVCAADNLTCVDSDLMNSNGAATDCTTPVTSGLNFWAMCQ